MKPHFAEDIWEKLLAVWRKDYRAGEEPDYREEQMRQLLKTMFMSRQALKLREKQEYDVHEAWQRVNKRTRAKGSRRDSRMDEICRFVYPVFGDRLLVESI